MTIYKSHKAHKNLEPMDIQSLKKNEVFRLKGTRAGLLISCLEGMIWITQKGDGFDWILSAGERFHTRISGDLVVEAVKDSRMMVAPQEKIGLVQPLTVPVREKIGCPC